jgi:oligopeptide transport system permease protein
METRRSNLTPEHFVPLDMGVQESERIVGRPIGFWEDSWNRLKKNRGALISLVLIILLFAWPSWSDRCSHGIRLSPRI